MNIWLRRLHLLLTIGGGFTGAIVTLQALFAAQGAAPVYYVLLVVFAGLYGFGVITGLRFAETSQPTKSLVLYYFLQVPWISSPLIAYRFAAGFHLSGAILNGQLAGFFRVGSDWQFSLLQAAPWGVGVNVFALAMGLLTLKQFVKAQAPVPPKLEPEPPVATTPPSL